MNRNAVIHLYFMQAGLLNVIVLPTLNPSGDPEGGPLVGGGGACGGCRHTSRKDDETNVSNCWSKK